MTMTVSLMVVARLGQVTRVNSAQASLKKPWPKLGRVKLRPSDLTGCLMGRLYHVHLGGVYTATSEVLRSDSSDGEKCDTIVLV